MAGNTEMSSMNEALKQSINIHEDLSNSKEELFKNIEGASARLEQFQSSKPKLQKVTDMLRDPSTYEKYYVPRAVAIGPFHHAKERCQLAEKFKLALTEKFVNDSGCTAEDLYKIIEDNISILRDCYDEEATRSYTDGALTQLFFIDGCSTLQFIYSCTQNELADFKIKRDQVAFAQQDLFLLENQLPYQVFKLLMNQSTKTEELNEAIHDFVRDHIMAATKQTKKHKKVHQPEHRIIMDEPTHLLELLRTEMLGPKYDDGNKYRTCPNHRQSFRNIQQLKAAGIQVKPSKTGTLKDISFESLGFVGFLYLPPISVDDSMVPKFLNLIAYEMCPDFQNDYGVTSYICFLDSLIDHADDVEELRSADVLYNFLGSDEEVARIFNDIGTDLVPNSDIYCSVKIEIEKHYKSKAKTWMAQFCHEHFRSPWIILAFLGVLVALGLSGIQTWYTITSPRSACDAVCEYLKKQLRIESHTHTHT